MSEETIGFCLHCGGESRVIQSKKGKESLYAIECSICSIKRRGVGCLGFKVGEGRMKLRDKDISDIFLILFIIFIVKTILKGF